MALAELPHAQREAFLLHEEAGLTAFEIAAVTGSEPEAVKSRLRYAFSKLKEATVRRVLLPWASSNTVPASFGPRGHAKSAPHRPHLNAFLIPPHAER